MIPIRHLGRVILAVLLVCLGFPEKLLAEPAFTLEELQSIFRSNPGVTIQALPPDAFVVEQQVNGHDLSIGLINNDESVTFLFSMLGNQGEPHIPLEIINAWNKEKIHSAYYEGDNIVLQANVFVGQKNASGPTIPLDYIQKNYDYFVKSSIEFLDYIAAQREANKQKTATTTRRNNTPNTPSSIDALANGFLQSLQNAANVGSTEEIQRRINAGDYTVVDELNQAFKGMDQATQDFNRRAGITDEQARELQRESRCRDACAKEYSGCVASCPSGGNGHSCRHSCSSYKEACLIRCK